MNWRIKRIGQAFLTVYLVITLSFFMIRFMPGGPMDYIMAQLSGSVGGAMGSTGTSASDEELQQMYELAQLYLNLNPGAPMHIAYYDFVVRTLQGNLGQSILYTQPVAKILGGALPWTLLVLSWGVFFGFLIGILLGAIMAYWEGGKLDMALTSYSVLMSSIPFYVLALFLLVYLAYQMGLFPISGRVPEGVTPGLNWPFIAGVIEYATLPVLSTIVLSGLASLAMRGNSIRVLGSDYIRVARLRGLSDLTIATKYVARNAILPMYTGFMISIGTMFGGAVILEIIFVYRGVGYYLVEAARARDYPLMMGAFMLITVAVVIALLIADLTYPVLDPRAGGEDRESF
jgi:peptide/nickel transport system permease protein